MEDAEIIALYINREESAIDYTKQKYHKRLTGLSYKILGNTQDCEECVSDTYFKLWEQIPPDKPSFFFAYTAKICRFLSLGRLDLLTAKKRTAEVQALTDELAQCIPDRLAELPFEEVALAEVLEGFLSGLTEEKRNVFLRRYWFSDTVKEIAFRYGWSESRVKTSLHRTREELRVYLEQEGIVV